MKPTCLISSPLFTNSGYGRWSLEIAKSLLRSDRYELLVAPQRWGNCSKKNLDPAFLDDQEKILVSKILKQPQLPKQPELFLQMSIPNEYQTVGKFNIGMTASIETSIPPAPWIEGINRMNLTIAMSKHGRDVLVGANFVKKFPDGRQEEVKALKPVETCPWGVNTKVFYKTDEISESIEGIMSKIPEDFAFIFVGQWTSSGVFNDRKNIGNLIKTFMETFRNEKVKPALILKVNGATTSIVDKYDCLNRIKEVKDVVIASGGNDLPNVYLVHGDLSDKEMNCLYNHKKVKAFISFTRGEGWGGPLLEMTMVGKPVVASNWSGHLDFLNVEHCNFFKGDLVEVPPQSRNEWLIEGSKWFEVNYMEASGRLKSLYHYYGSYTEGSEKLMIENKEKFSTEAMDKIFYGLLDKYVPQFSVQQSIILPKLRKITLPKLTKIENVATPVVPENKLAIVPEETKPLPVNEPK